MNMKICFYNSITNFRFLSEISVRDKFQLISIKQFKSLIVYSLKPHIVLSKMKIMILENLSIIDRIQLYSSDSDFGNVKIKLMIKIWNDLADEKIDYRKLYNL